MTSRFEPPGDFDLEQAWDEITAGYSRRAANITVDALVEDEWLGALRALGVEAVVHGAAARSGWSKVTLGSFKPEALAAQLAGVMVGIELIDPPSALVERLAIIGRVLVTRFDTTPAPSSPASSQR